MLCVFFFLCGDLVECAVGVLVQQWKIGWDHIRKKRLQLSLITFDLDPTVCTHTQTDKHITVYKKEKSAMPLPTTINVWLRIEHKQGGICIWLHSSHCERRQLLRYCRFLRGGVWLDLTVDCRCHKVFQGESRNLSFVSHLMRPLASEVCFQRLMSFTFHSAEPCISHTQPTVYDARHWEGVNLHFTDHQRRSRHCTEFK